MKTSIGNNFVDSFALDPFLSPRRQTTIYFIDSLVSKNSQFHHCKDLSPTCSSVESSRSLGFGCSTEIGVVIPKFFAGEAEAAFAEDHILMINTRYCGHFINVSLDIGQQTLTHY